MAGPFAITVASDTVLLDDQRRAQTTFTVSNLSGRPMRSSARLVAENPVVAEWLTLIGETERDLPIAGTEQYDVSLAVPATVPAGSYPFRLDMVGIENPDELFTRGPTVMIPVPPAKAKKIFPIWIPLLVIVGILLVISFVVFVLATNR